MKRFWIGLGVLSGLLAAWVATVALASLVVRWRVPVELPTGPDVIQSYGFVFASGTWTIEGGPKQAFPLQTTKIECNPETRVCTTATAQVSFGSFLRVDIESSSVTAWTASQVVFSDDSSLCVTYVYTIDLATKSVNGVRRRRSGTPAALRCEDMDRELRLTMRSGSDVHRSLEAEAMPWFGRLALAPLALF